jgi:hypothetical protein
MERLRNYGIVFDADIGLFTSRIAWDLPYTTYGRHASLKLFTERELIAELAKYDMNPQFIQHHAEDLVLGFHVMRAIWVLLHPITVVGPPSEYFRTPDEKAQADLEAIKRYGY